MDFLKASLLLLILVCASYSSQAQTPSADTILLHGRIYTVDAKHPWTEAVAIREGKILAVGNEREMAPFRSASTKVIDAKGHLVLPGLTDCHTHFMEGSAFIEELDLNDAGSVDEILKRVKAYAAGHPNEPWILGRGWTYPLFPPDGLPSKKLLDEIVPDRPVYLEAYDGHTRWANSKALELAHINKETPDPEGGKFVRDPSGEPTGALKEDAADAIMRKAIPEPSPEAKLRSLRAGLKQAAELGVMRVHALGEIPSSIDDFKNLRLYDQLRRSGELTVRFYIAYHVDPPEVTESQLRAILHARDVYHDDWISAGAVKFFMDGVIETHTAAMLEPYSNDPPGSGQLLWNLDSYKRAVSELDRNGIQVFTHAIGDRAIRVTLDAYQSAAEVNHTKDARHRIEHIEDVSAADIPRFGQLGVIASMQPLHAYPGDDTLKSWVPAVGPEREHRAFAWHSIQDHGGVLAFGSDWPVVTLSPWEGLQNAVTRQTADGKPQGGWIPSERISLEDAIRGYTLNAAFAGHREKSEGSLEGGKVADLIILSQDLFRIDPLKIRHTKVLLTMVGGRVVYRAQGF